MPTRDKNNQPWIRPLPERVVNKIAAGEVIERPAAVVKELVENSLDAGATQIDIFTEQAGIKLIKIVDNGCGIPEEQLEIAFSRHATSKINSFDDLDALNSYGFRGEALPSVASVSRLRMVSRVRDSISGMEIIIEGGVLQSVQPSPSAIGTTIEVEDLFYNTPARRKFLKADSTESRHISRTATALALANHTIGFSYHSNGRKLFAVPSGQSLLERVQELLGREKRFVPVRSDNNVLGLEGFIGAPDFVQNNRYGLFLFINGRYIFSPIISHALKSAYGEMIHGGAYPVGAVLLTLDPGTVDVNVHPSKTEVRLSNEREIHQSVRHLVREALRQDGIIPVLGAAQLSSEASLKSTGTAPPRRDNYIPGIMDRDYSSGSILSEITSARSNEDRVAFSPPGIDHDTGEITESPSPHSESSMASEGPSGGFRYIGRLSDLYLLLQAGEDLFIVDQHTAHERVLYEEMLKQIETVSVCSQTLLFPAQIELSPEQYELFEEFSEDLRKSGFDIEPFGGRMVNVQAMPNVMARKSPEKVLVRILDDILSLRRSGYDFKKAMAQSIACRAAVMAGDRLGETEAVHLLKQLLECENCYSCPHGRPTFVKVTRRDLDKQFGRA